MSKITPECRTASATAGQSSLVAAPGISRGMVALFALTTGVIIANLTAAQPLLDLISTSLGLSAAAAGLVSTLMLLGYAAGLFFVVPLADLLENRRLILRMLGTTVVAAAALAAAPSAQIFLPLTFLLGASCSVIQMLVPIAAGMAEPEHRGRVVGDVMGGVMAGILLSRPIASFMADLFGWRSYFILSAALMAGLVLVLSRALPRRQPPVHSSYGQLIASLWGLLRDEPVLRWRAASAALCMGAFSTFWTVIVFRLAEAPFNLSHSSVALFALFGAGGVVATPFAGRAGDNGWTRSATRLGQLIALLAIALIAWGGSSWAVAHPIAALVLLAVGAFLLDAGSVADQTLGRRAINMIRPEARGRINALFVGVFFIGGSLGSSLSGLVFQHFGWAGVCAQAAAFLAAAFASNLIGGRSANPADVILHP